MGFPVQAASLDLFSPSCVSLCQVTKKKKKMHVKDETPPVFLPRVLCLLWSLEPLMRKST